jgi:translation initiation factor 2B subunit (eIF-2B alpha/beta/delta family)
MAGVWNAALQAAASAANPAAFAAFAARVSRSEQAIIRFGLECFEAGAGGPLRLATFSFSRTTVAVITALSESREVRVACAEGRPMGEGQRMATALAAAGIDVTYYTDAAIGQALGAVDAVVIGADAITPHAVINKSGTRLLAAAAAHQGVPVHVVAGREKFVSQAVSLQLAVREGAADEVWPAPPPRVEVRNAYFEPTPLDLITSVITDSGVIGAALIPEVCEAAPNSRMLEELLKGR